MQEAIMRRTDKATERRMEIARGVDATLIQYLKDKPASTIYEISKGLSWSVGKVQGSINRVKSQLVVKDVVEGGRLKRKYDFPE